MIAPLPAWSILRGTSSAQTPRFDQIISDQIILLNFQEAVSFDPTLTFWCYLLVRTLLGVLTAASLMMFEGAVMATIQEMGGDYGLQRFVGNFGAIIFAPLGGFLIDTSSWDLTKTDFSSVFYVYLGLKLMAAFLILFIR